MLNWQNYMYSTKNTNRANLCFTENKYQANLFFIKYKFRHFIIR